MSGQLMSPNEVADYLGVSLEWVQVSLRDATLPARKIRGRWYVSRPELDAWLVGEPRRATQPARRLLVKGRPPRQGRPTPLAGERPPGRRA